MANVIMAVTSSLWISDTQWCADHNEAKNIMSIIFEPFFKQISPIERYFEPHGKLSPSSRGKISQTYTKSLILPSCLSSML